MARSAQAGAVRICRSETRGREFSRRCSDGLQHDMKKACRAFLGFFSQREVQRGGSNRESSPLANCLLICCLCAGLEAFLPKALSLEAFGPNGRIKGESLARARNDVLTKPSPLPSSKSSSISEIHILLHFYQTHCLLISFDLQRAIITLLLLAVLCLACVAAHDRQPLFADSQRFASGSRALPQRFQEMVQRR